MRARFVVGIVMPSGGGSFRSLGVHAFRSRGIQAIVESFSARHDAELQLRLSEMFLWERRAYILGTSLRRSVLPFLDRVLLPLSADGGVDIVLNCGGVLCGASISSASPPCLSEHDRVLSCVDLIIRSADSCSPLAN